MKKSILLFCASLVLGGMMTSCTKEDLKERADNTAEMVTTASDYSEAENAFEDIFDVVDEAAQQVGDLNGFVEEEAADDRGCADVTVERTLPGNFPLTLSLDYTDDGCTLNDGRAVSGAITAVFTGRLREAGSIFTITFTDFVLDGKTINGTKTITNNGLNGDGQLSYDIVVENGSVLFANGNTVTYITNRTRTWVEGKDTDFENDGMSGILDDVWEITGTASGLNRDGNSYEVNITTPLRRAMNCRWLTAGILELDTDALSSTLSIDFGTGTCDDQAMARLGLISRAITMK